MSTLLWVKASPRGDRSRSNSAAQVFVDAYLAANSDDQLCVIDIFEKGLPPFAGPALEAKYNILHQRESTAEQREAWAIVESIIEEFKSGDKYVFSVPMWNFGIPYRLKQYIDILLQPGYTFSFDPEAGYSGLVTGKPAVTVYARGGDYSPQEAAPMDFQKPYLETILRFMGFDDVQSVVVEPTMMGAPEDTKAVFDAAKKQAEELAKAF